MDTDASLLDRFSAALARILHDERPEALTRPVTVAQLYQEIAPYRRMRELAGIELHADYEHALLRLLAGENGIARLEPEEARLQLAAEAELIEPDLSAYRRFAACDVRLNAPALATAAERPGASTHAPPESASMPQGRPKNEGRQQSGAGTEGCVFCGQPLPEGREVRFCPYCGADQATHPCAQCGERLEPGWSYCIACGSTAEA